MNKFVSVDERGEIASISTIADDDDAEEYLRLNPDVFQADPEDDDDDIINNRYVKDGEWKWRTPAPSGRHVWDLEKEAWVEDIDGERTRALSELKVRAEMERSRNIGPGQAATYEAKWQEASRYPDGEFPFLLREAEEMGLPLSEVVDSVKRARARWEERGASIEARRRKAKKRISESEQPLKMRRILDAAFPPVGSEDDMNHP